MFIILAGFALVMPFLSLLLISLYYLQYKKPVQSAVLYGFAAAATFYNYIPDAGNDSIRHMYNLRYYMGIPIWKCFDAGHYTQTYVWDLWCWIVAQFKLPYLLPATGAFVGYALTMYLALDYCNLIEASKKTRIIAILLAFLMSSPVGIAIGIRNSNAFLICILGMYLCEIRHRPKVLGLMLMITGVLIHHSALLLLVMWIIYPLFKKKPLRVGIVVGIALLSLTIISNYVLNAFSGSNWIIQMIIDTFKGATAYQTDNNYNAAVSTNLKYKIDSINSILMIVLMLARCKMSSRSQEIYSVNNKLVLNTLRLSELFSIVTFALMLVLTINGGRYTSVARMFAFLSMLVSYQDVPHMPRTKNQMIILCVDICIIITVLMSVALSVYTLTWGNASVESLVGGLLGGVLYSIITLFP